VSNHEQHEQPAPSRRAGDRDLQEALAKLAACGVVAGQRYRHYDSGDIYVVRDIGLFESELEPIVAYARDAPPNPPPIVWMRFLSVFRGRAIKDNVLVPRFTLVES
jgi:hypothetical protein